MKKIVILVLCMLCSETQAQNFQVLSRYGADVDRRITEKAEEMRRDISVAWFGKELRDWDQPCVITWSVDRPAGVKYSGLTVYDSSGRRPRNIRISMYGTLNEIMFDVLPHEIGHAVIRDGLGFRLPLWADEGLCSTLESDVSLRRLQAHLFGKLKAEQGIPTNVILMSRTYRGDPGVFYSQAVSLTRWLLYLGDASDYLDLHRTYRQTGTWTGSLKTVYGFDSIAEMQNDWLKWVAAGSPKIEARAKQDIDTSNLPFRPGIRETRQQPRQEADLEDLEDTEPDPIPTLNAPENSRSFTSTPCPPGSVNVRISDELVNRIVSKVMVEINNSNVINQGGEVSQDQINQIVNQVVSIVLNDPSLKPGDPESVDYTKIQQMITQTVSLAINEAIDNLPPAFLQPVKGDGTPKGDPLEVVLGQTRPMPPMQVQTYDWESNLKDSETYAYPGPVKIRYPKPVGTVTD